MNNHKQLKTGADPRGLADYTALRDELAKLNHPARPDVDWLRVEQLSLALFRQNGVELQTASWYTLARTRLAGIAGLNEGLLILKALLIHQWGAMWPKQVHARVDILTGLSQRLQSVLRTLTLSYADLPQVYQAEQHLDALREVLQRLELKNVSQIGELCIFMHNTATRLENMDAGSDSSVATLIPAAAANLPLRPQVELKEVVSLPPLNEMWVDKAPEDPAESLQPTSPPQSVPRTRGWRSFIAGMLTMLILGAGALWGWHKIDPAPESPLPLAANVVSLTALEQLSPLWRQNYGFALANRAGTGTVEADELAARWQRYISGNALPIEDLSGWHQGMEGLQDLTRRLNTLDERKGKYLTGSELKSMVFTITQHFSRTKPLEEQLYLLSQTTTDSPILPGQLAQTDTQINQLLNRYALIKQQGEKP